MGVVVLLAGASVAGGIGWLVGTIASGDWTVIVIGSGYVALLSLIGWLLLLPFLISGALAWSFGGVAFARWAGRSARLADRAS